jgi:hypothetical protein
MMCALGYSKVLLCNSVFRIALCARVNIKAGTELFFCYGYDAKLTQKYKQPKSNVVAVKDVVKSAVKVQVKTKKSSSHKSSTPSIPGDASEAKRKALAKARAIKAEKRAATRAESSSQDANSHRTGLQQARKTAASMPHHSRTVRATERRDRVKTVRGSGMVEDSNASESAMDVDDDNMSEKVVQETDNEDDEFMPEGGLQEGPEANDPHLNDAEEEDMDRESRPRRQLKLVKSAQSVVAVKKKMGGARTGAGRKRKLRVILNSEDEE